MHGSTGHRRLRRSGAASVALGLVLGVAGVLGVGTSVAGTGLEFAAANPGTYDHTNPPAAASGTFGYHDGSNQYVVEQLQGGDYDCDQVVPFFTKIDLGGTSSVDLNFTFDRFTTGHKAAAPGVGYRAIVGIEASSGDASFDVGSTTLTTGTSFDAAHVYATATVSNLAADSVYILRVDARIGCDAGADPKDNTGNLLASMDASVPGGAQTVPMKSAANIIVPDDKATLTVVKDAVPDDPQDFVFGLTSATTQTAFTLDDGADDDGFTSATVFALDPGEYTISETPVGGWSFTDAVCSNEVESDTTPSVTVSLEAGDDVTCTFTNTKNALPTTTTAPRFVPTPDIVTTVPPTTTTQPPTTTTQPPTTTTAAPTTTTTPVVAPTVAVLGVQLARTGQDSAVLVAFGALLLAGGAALLVAARQRTSRLVP